MPININGTGKTVTIIKSAGGATNTGPSQRLSLDANHVLAYNCDETSGTTLANSVGAGLYPLTLQGTGYALGSTDLFEFGTKAVSFTQADDVTGALNSSVSVNLSSGFTLETTLTTNTIVGSSPNIGGAAVNVVDASYQNGLYIAASSNWTALPVSWIQAGVIIGNSYTTVALTDTDAATPRLNIVVTFNNTTLKFYINGLLIKSTNVSGNVGTLTQVSLGNRAGLSSNQPWKGLISDVRVSNIARDHDYVVQAFRASSRM